MTPSGGSVSGLPLFVELAEAFEDVFHLLDWSHEVCNSKVVGTGLLFEATSGHGHDSGLVDHVHAVEEIGFDSFRVGFVYKLLGEVHTRETVHSSFDFSARNILHVVEGLGEQISFIFHGSVQSVVLFLVQINSLI